jgi:hypothetical protein
MSKTMADQSRSERRVGKGRTFQQRLDDEMQDFSIVYQQIARSLTNPATLDEDTIVPSEWERAFDIDFQSLRFQERPGRPCPGSGQAGPSATKIEKPASSSKRPKSLEQRFHQPTEITRQAIRAVIKHYQLYDFRPRRLLNMRKVPIDIRLAEGLLSSEPPIDAWSRVTTDDPIFWRTLLEIFCRAFDAGGGAPEFWNKRKYFELACDAVMIREKLSNWSKAEAAKFLSKNKPYSQKYVESRANNARIERNKIRGSAGIARRLSELEKWIGTLNVEGLGRLREKDRALFDDVFNRALGLIWL